MLKITKTIGACIMIAMSSISYGQRYVDDLFEEVKETSSILYSSGALQPIPSTNHQFLPKNSNVQEHTSVPVDLYMDVYEPVDDKVDNRPVLVICFGGGFAQGSRHLGDVKTLATTYAQKGYVVAAIDYRLGINVMDRGASQRALYRGVQDSRTAIRFLRANALTYRIDPSKVYIVGISAGGMIALHHNYLEDEERTAGTKETVYQYSPDGVNDFETFDIPDLDCLDCIGGHQEFSGKANGVVAFAGALGDLSFIDGKSNAATLLFHSRDDQQVPFECGKPFGGDQTQLEKVYGSKAIYDHALLKGARVELMAFEDRGHGVHTPDGTRIYADVASRMTQFLFGILNERSPTLSSNNPLIYKEKKLTVYPNPIKLHQPFYISSTLPSKEDIHIRLFDVAGHVVDNSTYTSFEELEKLYPKKNIFERAGVYICQVQVGDTIVSKKIVVLEGQ